MSGDACSADDLRLLTKHEQSTPKIEMNIGHWYRDEFGNKTREIKALDTVEKSE